MSKARRGATALAGVLLVDKPAALSSHGVIARLRRLTGEGRIGHAGTLDPAATGLLVVLFGPATKLSDRLHAADKRYEATICFGAQTSTDDREGEVIARAPVAPELFEPAQAQAVLDRFLGTQQQQPPQFSAVKVGGVKGYEAARKGHELQIAPRQIEVFEARLLSTDAQAQTWTVDFLVSKGTYLRVLARDIGRAAGSCAHLSALRRTQSGALSLRDAHTLEEIEQHVRDADGDPLAVAELFCERATLEAGSAPGGEQEELSLPLPQRVANPRRPDSVVALGVFDGVHRGHQALLAAARATADEQGLPLTVLCFDPLPEHTICPQKAPALLTDITQRVALLKHYGADQVEVIDFSPALAQATPEFFALQVIPSRVKPAQLFIGQNFRFGAGARGDVALLAQLLDCPVTTLPLAVDDRGQTAVSSTRIRALLADAQLDDAYALLGHTLDLSGTVVAGSGLGRTLGYPTANLDLGPWRDPLCFAEGVYAATARINGALYPVGLFIGRARSAGVEQERATVEAHVLDYDGPQLYGKELTVTPLRYLAPIQRFASSTELTDAIGAWLFAIRQELS